MVREKEVAEGFKLTEVGVIPEDWLLITYGEVFDFLSTATYSRSELSINGDIGCVHYGDIHTKWTHFLDFLKYELPKIKVEQLKNLVALSIGDL